MNWTTWEINLFVQCAVFAAGVATAVYLVTMNSR